MSPELSCSEQVASGNAPFWGFATDLPTHAKIPPPSRQGGQAVWPEPAKDGAMPLILFCPIILGLGLGCHPGRSQIIPCLLYGCD
jgi:hypothetical protein